MGRRISLPCIVLALAACERPVPPAPPPAPPAPAAAPAEEVVQRVRAATGIVLARTGSVERRGVGFVVSAGEKHAHVVTDANVTGSSTDARSVTVTLDGRVTPALVVHEDGTWVVLRVERAGGPALSLAPVETEQVFVGVFGSDGFSLRATGCSRSDRNAWLDAEQDAAAAGAPVVDISGRLVGVLAGARASSERLKLVRPLSAIAAFFDPHVAEPATRSGADPFGEWGLIVRARIVDPVDRVREAHFGLGPADRTSADLRPQAGGGYAPVLGEAKMQLMTMADGAVVGHAVAPAGSYVWQMRLTLRDGSTRFTAPGRVRVEEARVERAAAATDTTGLPRALAGARRTVAGADVVQVKLEAKDIVPRMIWSPDGQFVFVLETTGIVRKVSVPELREVRRVALRGTAGAMAISSEGLVVGHASVQAISVVELDDLEVARRIEVQSSAYVACARSSAVAFVTGGRRDQLEMVDVARGETVGLLPVRILQLLQMQGGGRSLIHEFGNITCTPDGRHLLCSSGNMLHRFSLTDDFDYDESVSLPTLPGRFEVSSDGSYVAVPFQFGYPGPGRPAQSGVHLVDIGNLQRAAVVIDSGLPTHVVGFDAKEGRVYVPKRGAAAGTAMGVYSMFGEAGPTIPIETATAETRQILAHPDGNRALVLTDLGLYWVELKR